MSMCDYCKHHGCSQPDWHIRAVVEGIMYCPKFKAWLKRNISMAYVTPAFVMDKKSVTRRDWALRTVSQFEFGTKVLVWDKQARFGGQPIGVLQLTENPFKQNTILMEEHEYDDEGFYYLDSRHKEIMGGKYVLVDLFDSWRESRDVFTVIRFKTLEVFPGMKDKYTTDEEIIRCVKALRKAFA